MGPNRPRTTPLVKMGSVNNIWHNITSVFFRYPVMCVIFFRAVYCNHVCKGGAGEGVGLGRDVLLKIMMFGLLTLCKIVGMMRFFTSVCDCLPHGGDAPL